MSCASTRCSPAQGAIEALAHHDRSTFVADDLATPVAVDGQIDAVLHLASPASPADYQRWPIETLRVGAIGTLHALELALAKTTELRRPGEDRPCVLPGRVLGSLGRIQTGS